MNYGDWFFVKKFKEINNFSKPTEELIDTMLKLYRAMFKNKKFRYFEQYPKNFDVNNFKECCFEKIGTKIKVVFTLTKIEYEYWKMVQTWA